MPLFCPFMNEDIKREVMDTLNSKWLGQGPKVDKFEQEFSKKFNQPYAIFLNSGSSALEFAYELAGISAGDEVVTTPYTCTATNIPLLRMGAKVVFADIRKDTLNIDFRDVQKRITEKTKAIVNVHMGGIESPFEGEIPMEVKMISDACQALGIFTGDCTANSFQAIKHFTTGDGGMLTVNNPEEYREVKLKRWYGIDREKKRDLNWKPYQRREMTFDIDMLGFKRQPTDIDASMALGGLRAYDTIIQYRKTLFERYKENLKGIDGITVVDGERSMYWLMTVLVEKRDDFADIMEANGVEVNIVHVRNDAYKIFGGRRDDLPNMDWVESRYICLPLHMNMTVKDVDYITDCIKKGW